MASVLGSIRDSVLWRLYCGSCNIVVLRILDGGISIVASALGLYCGISMVGSVLGLN